MSGKSTQIAEFGREIDRHLGASFCAAKWKELNLYLHLGQGHSCYHPPPQKIDPRELAENVGALHNPSWKIQEREKMLRGEKPVGCQYCWDIERSGGDAMSDRRIKNFEHTGGSIDLAEEIFSEGLSPNVSPDALEISFSNKCNLKCMYCNPKSSSYWGDEISEFGDYGNIENNFALHDRILAEENEYVDAFNKWYPLTEKKLKTLRLTGGEPLLHGQTWKLLKDLLTNPRPELIISINSNFSVPRATVQRLADAINEVERAGGCRKIRLYISMEAVGKKAEAVRFGLNYELWRENVEAILKDTNCEISFMSTYNIFSVYGFEEFLDLALELRQRHCRERRRIHMDIPHLVLPRMFHVGILSRSEQGLLVSAVDKMRKHMSDSDPTKFSSVEIMLLERILKIWNENDFSEFEKSKLRRDLIHFINESDRRRGTAVRAVFPRLAEAMEAWENE